MVGVATEERELKLVDDLADGQDGYPVDMPMDVLLGKPPQMHRDVTRVAAERIPVDVTGVSLADAAVSVLRHPTVASKSFLITIGDRTVGGTSVPRPDGRPVAGAGGRLRRHRARATTATPARR